MKKLLTIGEFAKLRNIDKKALRYYEEIEILKPIYTNPKTLYRYYSIEQLPQLDTILMCLELNIPLKQANKYKDETGNIDIFKLYVDGKQKATEKINQLQTIITRLEHGICKLCQNNKYKQKKSYYREYTNDRYLLIKPIKNNITHLEFTKEAANLFLKAYSLSLLPMYNLPISILIENINNQYKYYITLDIYITDEKLNNLSQLFKIPSGKYLSQQQQTKYLSDIFKCQQQFQNENKFNYMLVSNLSINELNKNTVPIEIQYINNTNNS